MKEKQIWVVTLVDTGYGGSTSVLGVVYDLDAFKAMAFYDYGLTEEPIKDHYGRGSLHYEYSVKKSEKYSEYYHLVAELARVIKGKKENLK